MFTPSANKQETPTGQDRVEQGGQGSAFMMGGRDVRRGRAW